MRARSASAEGEVRCCSEWCLGLREKSIAVAKDPLAPARFAVFACPVYFVAFNRGSLSSPGSPGSPVTRIT